MILGKIVNPASEQSDDPIGGMRHQFSLQGRTTFSGQLCDPFRRLFTFYHCQLYSLSIFKSHFGERFKNAIFIKSFDAFCHGTTSVVEQSLTSKFIEWSRFCQIRHSADNLAGNLLKTGKHIGLTIPQSVLYRADRVIK